VTQNSSIANWHSFKQYSLKPNYEKHVNHQTTYIGLHTVLHPRQHSIGYMGDGFYRAMHFSAKRGIAIACRLSVRLSVCNVGEL